MYPNSRTCPALRSSRTAPLPPVRRDSQTPFRRSTMRTYLCSRLIGMTLICENRRKLDIENERLPPAAEPESSSDVDSAPSTPGSSVPPSSPFYRRSSMTAASTRKRSVDSTLTRIREAADGVENDEEFEKLADHVAGTANVPS